MSILSNEMKAFLKPWIERVELQLEPGVKKKEQECTHDVAREDLKAKSAFFDFLIIASQRPSVEQYGLINTHNVTNVNHYHTHVEAEDATGTKANEKRKEKKPEVNWKNIAIITSISTVIASVSVFVYTRLAKTGERAQNYLEKTKMIKAFAETSLNRNNDYIIALKNVADAQQKIDQNAVDKITGYKHATLSTLVGVVVGASGAIAMPWFATAGTIGVLFGMITIGGSTVYATYNLASHWDDKKEAQEKLKEIQSSLDYLSGKTSPNIENQASSTDRQPAYNPDYTNNEEDLPPTYTESQRAYGYGYIGTERLYPVLPEYQKA